MTAFTNDIKFDRVILSVREALAEALNYHIVAAPLNSSIHEEIYAILAFLGFNDNALPSALRYYDFSLVVKASGDVDAEKLLSDTDYAIKTLTAPTIKSSQITASLFHQPTNKQTEIMFNFTVLIVGSEQTT